MIWRLGVVTLVFSVVGLLPGAGMAHVEGPLASGFIAGFAHPFAALTALIGIVLLTGV